MECFVYNWRILLGGAASAAIVAVGVAAPAFAQASGGGLQNGGSITTPLSGLNGG